MPASTSALRLHTPVNQRKHRPNTGKAKRNCSVHHQPKGFKPNYLGLAISAVLGTLAMPSLAGPEGGLFI